MAYGIMMHYGFNTGEFPDASHKCQRPFSNQVLDFLEGHMCRVDLVQHCLEVPNQKLLQALAGGSGAV